MKHISQHGEIAIKQLHGLFEPVVSEKHQCKQMPSMPHIVYILKILKNLV